MRRFLALTVALGAGCADGDTVTIPIAAETGEVAVFAFWKEGRPQITLQPFTPGEQFAVDADEDRPIYSFVLKPDDFIDRTGQQISPERLATVRPRADRDPVGPDDCGRCLAATSVAPQTVFSGDACRIAEFAPGAVWRAEGDRARCEGGTDTRLCAAGSPEQIADIEAIRQQIVLVWPGECSCTPQDSPDLTGLDVEAISPVEDPWPIRAWAMTADGQVGGFRNEHAVRYDPSSQQTQRHRIDPLGATVVAATGLRDGAFLVAGRTFNLGSDSYRYFRFRPSEAGFEGPETIEIPVRPNDMRYLEPGGPLYIFGEVQRGLTLDPAILACDAALDCVRAPVSGCPDSGANVEPGEGRALPDGAAIARAYRALYVRPANAGPSGTWTCQQPDAFTWLDPAQTAPLPFVNGFYALGTSGSRAFVCADTRSTSPGCDPRQTLVLTADLAADGPWKAAYLTDAPCSAILDRGQDGVRVVLSTGRYVNFGSDGAVAGEGSVDEAYGAVDGRFAVVDFGDGITLHRALGHRTYLHRPADGLVPIYGPAAWPTARFEAAVALTDGRWAVFGDGFVRLIDDDGRFIDVPATGDDLGQITAAALESSPQSTATPVVMVGTNRGELAAVTLTDTASEIRRLDTRAWPASRIRGLAALGAGRFIAAGPGPRLLRIADGRVEQHPIAWDDPATDAIETEPTAQDGCTGAAVEPDIFRAIEARDGIAWAVGPPGVVLRVLPDRAERFAIGPGVAPNAVTVACPDQPRIVGQRGLEDDREFAFEFAAVYALESTPEHPRGKLVSLAEDDILAIADFRIRSGRPAGILRDGPWRDSQTSGFAFAMDNGFVYRMFTGRPPLYLRVPFDPLVVSQNSRGSTLFGAESGRIAIVRPQ